MFLAALLSLLSACGEAEKAGIDPANRAQVARGEGLYREHCAACHGAQLEGQPDWRRRLPNGRLPAPPHDASGHTWHHPNELLINITRDGMVPPWAPEGYASDMPGFGATLGDDGIRAVLAFIQSAWPAEVWAAREQMARQRR
jgi:mono/diheme cytochrome c family protein